ncbi:pimeloyl-ACP methyl ester carboxylesterase [Allocatelliglobosispora scoriae]|uniref:Pimeloyl-ACP methyl ester carboxylesterase n=1 Tax=Allocatelliglobosispora scoriae TaxID=643052 RepID=A0A841BTN7_9ACTN|nr:hypothetical protein [Allocatelliglobosispora scoriae]MBB5870112.1 pimeloyl-ACP methyl ester carboxylesterase [Allocatelliglobosispora scoriae]
MRMWSKLITAAATAALLSIGTATAGASAAHAAAKPTAPKPAAAAQAAGPQRADGNHRPVIFIHGFNRTGAGRDCVGYWGDTIPEFKDRGYTTRTWGFYGGDHNCSAVFKGTKNTSVKMLGREFAQYVYKNFSKPGRAVDVVGHSMGGLIVRAALTGTANREPGFPPYLYIEDAVTIATPHAGTKWALGCATTQCKDMRPRSTLLKWLQYVPQSRMGTDWTLVGSADDKIVPMSSSIYGMKLAPHLVWFPKAGGKLGHDKIQTVGYGGWRSYLWNEGDRRNRNDYGTWGHLTGPNPGRIAQNGSFFHHKY